MKKYIITSLFSLAILLGGLFFFINTTEAYTSVKGYYRSNGTYIQPYVRSTPNALKYDNYGYSGGSLYNNSYYNPSKNYSSNWNTPSYYTDSSYYSGKSLYNYNKYTSPSYSYPSYKSSYSSYFGW